MVPRLLPHARLIAVAAGERLHYLDAARTLLIASLIPYHACRAYSAYNDWGVMSPERSTAAAVVAAAIIMTLLPGFFLVSGLLSALSLDNTRPSAWARGRVVRLGVPLIAAALLLNPIQMAAVVANDRFHGVAGPSLAEMLTTPGEQWIRHLWFLPCLLGQSLLLAAVWSRLSPQRDRLEALARARLDTGFAWKFIAAAFLVGLACLAVAAVPKVIGWDMTLFRGMISLRNTLYYLPFFAIGVLLYLSPTLLDRFTQVHPLVVAAAAVMLVVQVFAWREAEAGLLMKSLSAFCRTSGGLLGTQVLLAAMRRRADRPSAAVAKLSAASFTIYLLHQSIVSALAALLLPIRLPPMVEVAGICAVTCALACAAWLVVRRSAVLMLLFGGVPLTPRARSA